MDETSKQFELIQKLTDIVAELGWVIALPEGDGIVDGLIVGTPQFAEEVGKLCYGDNFDIYQKNGDDNIVELPSGIKKAGDTIH